MALLCIEGELSRDSPSGRTEPDTEWTGIEERTGKVVCTMVGDDRRFVFDEEDITPIAREDYCGECGQMGCTHDGLTR